MTEQEHARRMLDSTLKMLLDLPGVQGVVIAATFDDPTMRGLVTYEVKDQDSEAAKLAVARAISAFQSRLLNDLLGHDRRPTDGTANLPSGPGVGQDPPPPPGP